MNDRFLPNVPSGRELVASPRFSSGHVIEAQAEQSDRSAYHLPNLVRILYRWRWLALSVLGFAVAASTIAAALQTPLYRATATLELNPAPARVVQTDDKADEARQSDRDFLALQLGLVKSRSVAEAVARRLNLARDEAFLKTPIAEGELKSAVGRLVNDFSATSTASDRIMQVSFVHPDAQVAAKVANAFADQFVETNIERGFAATGRSRQYLQQRLEATRQELENSERALIAYARQANIVNVSGGENAPSGGDTAGSTLLASNLLALNTQLAEAENARIVAQQRYAQASATSRSATATDPVVQTIQQQLAQLQSEYQQKLQRYLPDHPEMMGLRARIDGAEQQLRQAAGRTSSTTVGALRADMISARNREQQLRARINQLQGDMLNLGERGVRYAILRRAVDANRSLYNALLSRLGEENSSATKTSSISVIDTAQVPDAPFTPNIPRAVILGLLGGLVLGTGAAVAADKWYDTIDLPDAVRHLLGLPLLGVVPKVKSKEDVDEELANPQSSLAEAYHSVRASLQFIGNGTPPRSILLTSTKPGEGKTSSTIAIAADFVSLGLNVVVVDGDLRRPSLRGNQSSGGLSALLSGTIQLEAELTPTETPGLFLIQAGVTPPDPTVLLASSGFVQLIRELEKRFDVVIIDGPPVMGLADAPLIASIAEASVMVVEAGSTRRGMALNALRRLKQAGGNVVGGILTKFDDKHLGYGYGYSYEYEAAKRSKRPLVGYRGVEASVEA